MFSKEFGAKAGAAVSNKYQTQLKKTVFAAAKTHRSHCRYSVKEGLQGPAQVFSCQCCETFKNTYFEKRLRTAASENQHFIDKFPKGR